MIFNLKKIQNQNSNLVTENYLQSDRQGQKE